MAKSLHYIINYPYQVVADSSTFIHLSLFRPDFTPAAGAQVSLGGVPVGTADDDGICIFTFRPGENVEHALDAQLLDGRNKYRAQIGLKCNTRTAGFRSAALSVFTDSARYNPGDTIAVRVHAHELLGDYRPLVGAQVNLLLIREQGPPPEQVVCATTVRTDERGGAEAGLKIPASVPEGSYLLWVEYQGGRESRRLRIQKFSAADLEVTHNLTPYLTSAQTELEVQVTLSYVGGGRPEASELVLRAMHNDEELLVRSLSQASSEYAFTLSGPELTQIRSRLTVASPFQWVLEARDQAGKTGQIVRDVRLTERPFRAVLEFDKEEYCPEERVDLVIRLIDLYGQPATGIELLASLEDQKLALRATTDLHGMARLRLTMGERPAHLVLTTPHMTAEVARRELRLAPPKPMVSKADPILAADCRTRLRVEFDSAYVPVEKVVHVDFTDSSGSLVAATTLPIEHKDGKHQVDGVVMVAHWGTMLVNVYCAAVRQDSPNSGEPMSGANVGLITEGQRVTVYPGSDALLQLGKQTIATSGAAMLTWPRLDRSWGVGQSDIAFHGWGYQEPGPQDIAGKGRPMKLEHRQEPAPTAPVRSGSPTPLGMPLITIGTGAPRTAAWAGGTATALADVPDQITVQRVSFSSEEATRTPLVARSPRVTVARGKARRGSPWQTTCELSPKTQGAWLSLSLPTVVPALAAWDEKVEQSFTGVTGLAGRALADRALLEWGQAQGKSHEWCDSMRHRLAQAGAALVASQARDGGWRAMGREGTDQPGSQLFVTAYALKALSEIRRIGQLWQRGSLEKAIKFIWERQHSSGLWASQGSYFFETSTPSVDVAQSAQIFSILVQAYQALGGSPPPELQEVRFQLTRLLNQQYEEPAALAYTVDGLARWSAWVGKDFGLVRYLPALLELRRHGHWEPQWYNTYGGKVELNAFILEMLLTHFPGQHPLEVRETVRFLLSTREAWGVWHNEMGTVAAIRALVKAGAGLSGEVKSQLVVRVDEQEVARVNVDPDDPFLSAAQIGHVDLRGHLRPGQPMRVEVDYDGALEAAIVLEIQE